MLSSTPMSKTRLYKIFSGMKYRCYNKSSPLYPWYGGKGITICAEWMQPKGVYLFAEWAKNNGYNDSLTIDRIDSACGYSPSNCRWVSKSFNSSRAAQARWGNDWEAIVKSYLKRGNINAPNAEN